MIPMSSVAIFRSSHLQRSKMIGQPVRDRPAQYAREVDNGEEPSCKARGDAVIEREGLDSEPAEMNGSNARPLTSVYTLPLVADSHRKVEAETDYEAA